MVDATAIVGAVTGLKTASDTITAIIEAKGTINFQQKAIELQTQILTAQSNALAAQSAQMAHLSEISDLKSEIAKLKNWTAEKERYSLIEVEDSRHFAYAPNDEVNNTAPKHYLCANCFDHFQRKSILQHERRMPGNAQAYVCHMCGSELYTVGFWNKDHPKYPRVR